MVWYKYYIYDLLFKVHYQLRHMLYMHVSLNWSDSIHYLYRFGWKKNVWLQTININRQQV